MRKTIIIISIIIGSVTLLSGCNATAPIGTQIAHKIQKPGNDASNVGLQNDVKNAVIAVETYIASNPSSPDVSNVPVNASDPATKIVIAGAWDNYTVIGTNSRTGFTYSYNSTTGVYK